MTCRIVEIINDTTKSVGRASGNGTRFYARQYYVRCIVGRYYVSTMNCSATLRKPMDIAFQINAKHQ
jgi:hypothetical protein